MAKTDISSYSETDLVSLIDNRWTSSSELWDVVEKVYRRNTDIYANKADWLQNINHRRKPWTVQANRIFVNMESVINSLIANPPGLNVLPGRKGEKSQEYATKLENYFRKKYLDLNVKEVMRMGLRNLYFARFVVLKPFWNASINDFDVRAVDPRKVRVGKYARKEQDSEFCIEEIEDNLCSVIGRFPEKKEELMKKYGINDETQLYIKNPEVKYKEAWINDYVIFKLDSIILGKIKNSYWDWDGILVTDEENAQLEGNGNDIQPIEGDQRRELLSGIKTEQETRKAQQATQTPDYIPPTQGATSEQQAQPNLQAYYFNYFDTPRKPYIIATVFNNENSPIGRTDMITLSAELQRGIDKRKMDIDENCELANGIIKIDSSVMDKSDAQRIRFETKGIIFGKGVVAGVQRETGGTLPQMVFDDMIDSREEIDNIMAASSAFRGEREGQETKAGRLALIQQSYLRLNELVQTVDYLYYEMFSWFMQLAKTRYTEYHYAKWEGKDGARETIEIIQDDIEDGSEVKIIAGKTLPVDDEFKFEQAQNDFEKGALGLTDYLRIANYEDPKEVAKNTIAYQINKPVSVGMTPEEMQVLQPPQQEEKPPSISISYADLPPDAQVQLLAKVGIQADPNMIVAEKIAENESKKSEFNLKKQGQEHGQGIAEKSLEAKNQPKVEKKPSK